MIISDASVITNLISIDYIEDSTFGISPPLYNKILVLAGEKEDE